MYSIRRRLLLISLRPTEHVYSVNIPSTYTGKDFLCKAYFDNRLVFPTWAITAGSSYATINENGKVTINSGTVNRTITISSTYVYNNQTYTNSINTIISYDNQLVIEAADTITGTSGNVIARYNGDIITPTWAITSGNQYATIDATGAITIISSGTITISATYGGYTTTKDIVLVYESNTHTETVVDEDGNVTTTTTTETVDPETGSTTTTTTETTVNEDGSSSTTNSETIENQDGSSTTSTSTTNSDGSSSTSETITNSDGSSETNSSVTNADGTSSETNSQTSAPDPSTGSITTESTTVNYDENGDTTGSSENTTINNTDGSSSSSTTNYNADGDPTTGTNQNTDINNNVNTQDITYNEQGEPEVTGYTIDTTGNVSGTGEEITGSGVNTQFIPFDETNAGFICHIRFRTVKTEQPNPPIVEDTEDSGSNYLFNILTAKSPFKPYRGFHIRWALKKTNYSSGNLTLGYTSGTASSTTSRQIYGVNDIYDFRIIYDPQLLYYPSKFRVEDLQGRTSTISANIEFASNNMDFVLGYAINQEDQPYRYSNVTIYEFTIGRLTPPE